MKTNIIAAIIIASGMIIASLIYNYTERYIKVDGLVYDTWTGDCKHYEAYRGKMYITKIETRFKPAKEE
jgi:hypothetical protein